ncbi:MAG: DNA mismatch repair protein MutS [Candidatus Omnitrophica bacterium]|nr:DNA mismatch repair protein MutS [Candidatus Omnitrophota bacterium]
MNQSSPTLDQTIPASVSETPMLKQYHALKSKHQNCILFFRLGDFYEMFYEDAQIASRVLDLVLTSRGKSPSQKVPMCGIPHHAAENYIAKLIKEGHKVAICDQMEDPAMVKGIVKRDVTRIITKGTYLDQNDHQTRYILALSPHQKIVGVSFIDPTSGTIQTNQFSYNPKSLTEIIANLPISECIFPESLSDQIRSLFEQPILKSKNIVLSPFDDWCFNPDVTKKSLLDHFHVHNLVGFGIEDRHSSVSSCGALLEYLKQMNKQPIRHIDKIALYTNEDFVFISPAAHRGLEFDTLIRTIDFTQTALGKRKFKEWYYHPLKSKDQIEQRQQAATLLLSHPAIGRELKLLLGKIPDLEKNISRLGCGYTHPRDFMAIRNTLALLPDIKKIIQPLVEKNDYFQLADIKELRELLINAVKEHIPMAHYEGQIFNKGYHTELDELRGLQENGRAWLKKYQETEIQRSGINSLKIGFNKVFGYYIEITKTNIKHVPQEFIRKQTLANAERYITPELKEYEEKILTAQDKIVKIEQTLMMNLQQKILEQSLSLHQFCQTIAQIDCIQSMALLAESPNYILPEISIDSTIKITDGRHPVVENTTAETFIANDTLLDSQDNQLIILTGPNMAGKSTYIRQTALLVIMAQVGSYIPARQAHIGIVDKIFTRIGAHDDISKGQSTFMVEMNETADILNNMTEKSLVILDEIGRGTSTYDGLSLAWSLAEYLRTTNTRTLFATHFHELTGLADEYPCVKNYNVAVKEWKNEIIFLHKIIPGSSDDSYGIYVAKLAGIPENIISRARQILTQLELKKDLKEDLKKNFRHENQLSLFSSSKHPAFEEFKEMLDQININRLTPIEALTRLAEMKQKMDSYE